MNLNSQPGPWSGLAAFSAKNARLLYIVLGGVLVLYLLHPLRLTVSDPDVWWVAAAGRDFLLARGHAPDVNLYSFASEHTPWVMHEWLFAVPYALGLSRLGPIFFVMVALAAACLIAALVLRETVARCRHLLGGVLLAGLALLVYARHHASARPPSVAIVFPLAMMTLAFGRRFCWQQALGAVLLELIWTNAHGSFPLGLIILCCGAVESLFDRPHRPDLARRAAALLGAALVTWANPYGLRLHALVAGYFLGHSPIYRLLRRQIEEFASIKQAPYFHAATPPMLIGLLLLTGLLAWSAWTRRHPGRVLLGSLVLLLALLGVRHLPMAGLLLCMLMTPVLDELLGLAQGEWKKMHIGLLLGPAAALAGLTLLLVSHTSMRAPLSWIGEDQGRTAAVQLAAQLPPGARVLAPFAVAGPVIWFAYPRGVQVMYDSRNDCYDPQVFIDFFLLYWPGITQPEADRILAKYRVSHILVEQGSSLAPLLRSFAVLARQGRWSLLGPAPPRHF